MIWAAFLASLFGGFAAQYYFGNPGSVIVVSGIWIGVFLWKK